jgi:riboflavin biosynthesis pyrimidine reductase
MVGTRTALNDNPSLTVRDWSGNNALRIVLDRTGSLPKHLHLFDGKVQTLVATERTVTPTHNIDFVQLSFDDNLSAKSTDASSHNTNPIADCRGWTPAVAKLYRPKPMGRNTSLHRP